ncbi:MAG: hypothetical protein KatS3mg008_0979 [Acidimicrobiales bacterium]|nr:MAG: hypothetical protein KatS3mg008_0979 [Acidimicrobiales bacterium]
MRRGEHGSAGKPAEDRISPSTSQPSLAPRERQLLALLARADGRVLSKGRIAKEMGLSGPEADHYVEVLVARLRSRLSTGVTQIETVKRRGYRLVGPAPPISRSNQDSDDTCGDRVAEREP